MTWIATQTRMEAIYHFALLDRSLWVIFVSDRLYLHGFFKLHQHTILDFDHKQNLASTVSAPQGRTGCNSPRPTKFGPSQIAKIAGPNPYNTMKFVNASIADPITPHVT